MENYTYVEFDLDLVIICVKISTGISQDVLVCMIHDGPKIITYKIKVIYNNKRLKGRCNLFSAFKLIITI